MGKVETIQSASIKSGQYYDSGIVQNLLYQVTSDINANRCVTERDLIQINLDSQGVPTLNTTENSLFLVNNTNKLAVDVFVNAIEFTPSIYVEFIAANESSYLLPASAFTITCQGVYTLTTEYLPSQNLSVGDSSKIISNIKFGVGILEEVNINMVKNLYNPNTGTNIYSKVPYEIYINNGTKGNATLTVDTQGNQSFVTSNDDEIYKTDNGIVISHPLIDLSITITVDKADESGGSGGGTVTPTAAPTATPTPTSTPEP